MTLVIKILLLFIFFKRAILEEIDSADIEVSDISSLSKEISDDNVKKQNFIHKSKRKLSLNAKINENNDENSKESGSEDESEELSSDNK